MIPQKLQEEPDERIPAEADDAVQLRLRNAGCVDIARDRLGDTKKAIMRTFQQMLEEMPFDKITVSALVRRCEISSNTFYYHYQDIYALLDVWFHTVFDPYVQCDRPDFDWRTAIKEVLLFASKTALSSDFLTAFTELFEEYCVF